MTRLRALARRLAGEGAYTLTELLTVLGILGIVLASLSGVFVSALRAEVDMNERFQAQQEARLALGKLRREVRCAKTAAVAGDGTSVTLTAATSATSGYCVTGETTWCAVPRGPSRYGLFRQVGATCDGTGLLVADYLTTNAVFSFVVPTAGSREKLGIDLRVDAGAQAGGAYRLVDEITLRPSERA